MDMNRFINCLSEDEIITLESILWRRREDILTFRVNALILKMSKEEKDLTKDSLSFCDYIRDNYNVSLAVAHRALTELRKTHELD